MHVLNQKNGELTFAFSHSSYSGIIEYTELQNVMHPVQVIGTENTNMLINY